MENGKMTIANNEADTLKFAELVARMAMRRPLEERLSVINGIVNALVATVRETQEWHIGEDADDALERMVLSWISSADEMIGTNFGKYIKEFNKKDIFPESDEEGTDETEE